ncbi:MAG: hypothetical protein H6619_05220 [Deltaproteobacteria bacterium]|nr:hypothetical protein [Deltaproteobacteria bacterium]
MKRLLLSTILLYFSLSPYSLLADGSIHGTIRINGAPALNQNVAFLIDNKAPGDILYNTNEFIFLQDIINSTQTNLNFGSGENITRAFVADLPSSRDGYKDLVVELLATPFGSGNTKLVGLLNNRAGQFIPFPIPLGDSETANGTSIADIFHGDLDGDGFDDLIVGDFGTKNVIVDTRDTQFLPSSGIYAYNNINPIFKIFLSSGSAKNLTFDYEVREACISDIDNDGDLDIISLDATLYYFNYNGFGDYSFSFSVAVKLNDGNASFSTSYINVLDTNNKDISPSLHCADLNNDKLVDIIVESQSSPTGITKSYNIHSIMNNGAGNFATPTNQNFFFTVPQGTDKLVETLFGDYNNDGFADMATANALNGTKLVDIYYNLANPNLTSNFFNSPSIVVPSLADNMLTKPLFDFNGDGFIDLLFPSSSSSFTYNFAFNPGSTPFNTGNTAFTVTPPNTTDQWSYSRSTEVFDMYALTNVEVIIGQYTVYSDVAGRFKLNGIPAGIYPLTVNLNGYLFDNQSTVTVSNGSNTGLSINATVDTTPPSDGDSGDGSGSGNDNSGDSGSSGGGEGSGNSGGSENDLFDLGFSEPPAKPALSTKGNKLTIDLLAVQYASSYVCKVTEIFKKKSGKKKMHVKTHELAGLSLTRKVKKGAKVKVRCYAKNALSQTDWSNNAKVKVKK